MCIRDSLSTATDDDVRFLVQRHIKPTPRQGVAIPIPGIHAAIDLSDGLLFDLAHICEASQVSAVVQTQALPISQPLQNIGCDPIKSALTGGEDYELCLIVAPDQIEGLQRRAQISGVAVTKVGSIVQANGSGPQVQLEGWSDEQVLQLKRRGFTHFKEH